MVVGGYTDQNPPPPHTQSKLRGGATARLTNRQGCSNVYVSRLPKTGVGDMVSTHIVLSIGQIGYIKGNYSYIHTHPVKVGTIYK